MEETGKQGRPTPILYCEECDAEDPPFVEDDAFEECKMIGRTIILWDEL